MLSLWTGLGLRVRVAATAFALLALGLGYFAIRFWIASARLASARTKADALQGTRNLERRIAAARAKTREKQDKLREQIKARKKNDYFER
jgi:hypothetical protein